MCMLKKLSRPQKKKRNFSEKLFALSGGERKKSKFKHCLSNTKIYKKYWKHRFSHEEKMYKRPSPIIHGHH